MDEYIYCENDFKEAMRDSLRDCFGYDLIEFIQENAIKKLKQYTNLYRFYDRNCVGCVSGNTECDFAYGRGNAKDCWEKAKKGELFDCPVRTNGTMVFNTVGRNKELQDVDISDRDKPPYPIVKFKD